VGTGHFKEHILLAPGVGFEPTTNWLHRPVNFKTEWTISWSTTLRLDAGRFIQSSRL